MIGIYVITNLINNKKYIGQAVDIETRWKNHIRELNKGNHHNSPLQNAWNKYGMENFSFTILCECIEDDLNRLEIEYIEKYKTFMYREDKDVRGYNLTAGGDMGTRGRCGANATNTTKIICLNTMKVYDCAKLACDEYSIDASSLTNHLLRKPKRKSCGKSSNGEKLIWEYYDDKNSKEYYLKTKEEKLKLLNVSNTENVNPFPKRVVCLNNGLIFDTIASANDYAKVKGVGQACRLGYGCGFDNNGDRLKWMFYEEYLENIKESEVI